jgi:hypothetical protein
VLIDGVKFDLRILSMEKASGLLLMGEVEGVGTAVVGGRAAAVAAATASCGSTPGSGKLKNGRKRKGWGGSAEAA